MLIFCKIMQSIPAIRRSFPFWPSRNNLVSKFLLSELRCVLVHTHEFVLCYVAGTRRGKQKGILGRRGPHKVARPLLFVYFDYAT